MKAAFSVQSVPMLYTRKWNQMPLRDSNIGQGEPRHRKYKRLKLGGGQAYDRSSEQTAVVAGEINNRA
jgi:hypothetical protein